MKHLIALVSQANKRYAADLAKHGRLISAGMALVTGERPYCVFIKNGRLHFTAWH